MERQVWKRFAKPRYPIYHLKWNRLAFMSAEQFFDTITFIGCEKKNFFGALFLFIIIMLGRLSSNQNIARHRTKILRFWNLVFGTANLDRWAQILYQCGGVKEIFAGWLSLKWVGQGCKFWSSFTALVLYFFSFCCCCFFFLFCCLCWRWRRVNVSP